MVWTYIYVKKFMIRANHSQGMCGRKIEVAPKPRLGTHPISYKRILALINNAVLRGPKEKLHYFPCADSFHPYLLGFSFILIGPATVHWTKIITVVVFTPEPPAGSDPAEDMACAIGVPEKNRLGEQLRSANY